MNNLFFLLLTTVFAFLACQGQHSQVENFKQQAIEDAEFLKQQEEKKAKLQVGADQTHLYLKSITNKSVALVVNQTSTVSETHLVDTLLSLKINIQTIFAPEHGFRGTADAGEKIENGKDTKTGLPIISLYGNHKKPTEEDLKGIDIVVFDIQDVGARFYTYISTLHYVMEACAENDISLLILDRPNPNGHYVDGPTLEKEYQSFVGMHPIPVVHGMTIGEYAQMINGEKWLTDGIQCNVQIIECTNYDHNTQYELPIKPSPNLPNAQAIALYPSICFFEGTEVSVGRGTETPFQVIGNPYLTKEFIDYSFTPKSTSGAKYPKHEGKDCFGFNLQKVKIKDQLDLSYLITMYNLYPKKEIFFLENGFFEKLAGTKSLREAIIKGMTEEEIRKTWQADLEIFKKTRSQYLLYKDFE